MIVTAGMFAVLNGLIIAMIITGNSGRQRYKDTMDKVVEMLRSKLVGPDLARRVLRCVDHVHTDEQRSINTESTPAYTRC